MQIYKITNLINGKIYIGKDELSNEKYHGSGTLIKTAIKKYGVHNFTKEIIEDDINDKKILIEREKYWIKKYNCTDKSIGYNITDGGEGGDTISNNPNKEAIVEKIKSSMKGKPFTQEHKDRLKDNHNSKNPEVANKIALKLRGVKKSDEHRQNLSKAMSEHYRLSGGNINFKGDNNPFRKYKYHWYSNNNTGKAIRVKDGDEIPQGFIRGRLQIKGDNNPVNKNKQR